MKILSVILFFLTPIFVGAQGLPEQCNLMSNEFNSELTDGTFRIEGNVRMASSGEPLKKVLIGCESSDIWSRTDSEGYYNIDLKSSDSVVYFYLNGWYEVVIEDYLFQNQHHYKMDVDLFKTYDRPNMGNLKRKPVIYMYNNTNLSASIQLDPLGEFTFTYPEYNEGWNVEVDKDGGLIVDGLHYPYLFWEAESSEMHYKLENDRLLGALIKKTEVISFLEESLSEMGLNNTEKTDFITYWGPLLTKSNYAFIQFVVDDDYQSDIARLTIEPKPDKMKRIYILCSNLDDENLGVDLLPQNFKPFKREGFTVVEWGGTILDIENLQP